jgi:hypothetical protein
MKPLAVPSSLVVVAAIVTVLAAGCGLDTAGTAAGNVDGVDGSGPGDATTVDASSDVDLSDAIGVADAADSADGADGADGSDAADAGKDACTPAGAESCTNGVDDDCNAKIDCADPGCSAFVCSLPVTSGWSIVAAVFAAGASTPAACPAGYGASTLLEEGPTSSAATCTCTCGGNPCLSSATSPVNWRTGVSACNDGTNNIDLSGACSTFTSNATGGVILGGGFDPPGTGGTQPCTDTTALPSIAFTKTVRVCTAPAVAGAGCASGASCEPPVAPASLCLSHVGDVACAAGTKHVIGAGATVTDARTCGACGCSANACTSQRVEFFSDAACATKIATVASTGDVNVCPVVVGAFAGATRSKYFATANCTPTTPNPAIGGTLAFAQPTTLCCVP